LYAILLCPFYQAAHPFVEVIFGEGSPPPQNDYISRCALFDDASRTRRNDPLLMGAILGEYLP
jgi:hypothetical protein